MGLCGEDELLEQNYAPSLQTTLEQVEALCAAADRHSWDQVYACLPIPFPAVGRKRKRTRRKQCYHCRSAVLIKGRHYNQKVGNDND